MFEKDYSSSRHEEDVVEFGGKPVGDYISMHLLVFGLLGGHRNIDEVMPRKCSALLRWHAEKSWCSDGEGNGHLVGC